VTAASGPVRIRVASAADTAQVFAFIRDLAEYERLAHEVQASEVELRAHLFGPQPAAEVLIAEWQDHPAGFALFFTTFSTFLGKPGFWLEDLFVKPEHRGRGVGRALLAELARLAVARGHGRVEWAVLDWNESAKNFYGRLGAHMLDDWRTWRLTGEALRSLGR
jgi:GNAT superfamily N-acetyltransferase